MMNHALELAMTYGPALIGWCGTLVLIASALTALTPTPPPDSGLRRFYKAMEIGALVVGYAKDRGYMTQTARQTAVADEGIELGRQVLNTIMVPAVPKAMASQAVVGSMLEGQPLTPEHIGSAVEAAIAGLVSRGVLAPTSAPIALDDSAAPRSQNLESPTSPPGTVAAVQPTA